MQALVRTIAEHGVDAILLHKGRVRSVPVDCFRRVALVVHLSASTEHAPDSDEKVLVGHVDEALRLGADAVSVHVNMGSSTEASQLADLGIVAGACVRWGLPLIAMIYPRGPGLEDPWDAELVASTEQIMRSGVMGVAMGRNVFESQEVGQTVRAIARVVHRASGPGTTIAAARPKAAIRPASA